MKRLLKVLVIICTLAMVCMVFASCSKKSKKLPDFVDRYDLPEFTYGTQVCAFNSSGSTDVKRYSDTSLEDFNAYKNVLCTNEFSIYDENVIDNNHFVTLISDFLSVHLSWFSSPRTMRVICENKGDLCPLTDNCQTRVTPLLTGFKGDTSVAYEGMGYIIRLSDGSFCIIDSGMGDPNHIDSNNIMAILNEQKPEGVEKPVVAAWIFTHLHGDHVGSFNCFSLDHHDDIVLERLVYNFPREEEIELSDSVYMLDNSIYRWNQFKKNLNDFYSDVPVLKVHTGDRFQVRDAHFEVLFTLEDLYPQSILNGLGMNESSVLYKMTLAGQTFLWTGDFGTLANDLVLAEYSSETFSSDFLQLAHHGINGSVDLYSKVNPIYTLLPLWNRIESDGGTSIENMLKSEQNQWLVNSSKMKQMIITACGTWTISLPYNPNLDSVERIPTINTIYPKYPQLLGE